MVITISRSAADWPAAARSWTLAVISIAAVLAGTSSAAESVNARPSASCCNVVELRQYTLRPGRREVFIDLFDREFADPQDATGMTVIGQFRDLDRPDRFVWLRGFQNMEVRAKELGTFYDSDLWHAHRNEANASIDDSDNVLLLEPASPSLRFKNIAPRPAARDDATMSSGLIVATLYYTKADDLSAFGALFDRSLRRHVEAAGANTLAAYVTSTQANSFPRLPVRTGEHVFVWVAQFENPEAYAAYQSKLSAEKKWSQMLWPSARELLTQDPEVLRLTPTPRSRLRG